MIQVVNTLAPVVIMIGLGVFLHRIGFIKQGMAQWLSALTYWVALPALLFMECANARIDLASHADALTVLYAVTLICIALGYGVASAMRLQAGSAAAVVQAAFRGNLAYIGIPVIMYSFGEANKGSLAVGVLLVAATIPVYNALAVTVLLAAAHRLSWKTVIVLAVKIATNPLILACLAGLTLAWTGWHVPLLVDRTLQPLGRMALPLALISIGATLSLRDVHGQAMPIALASAIKVAIAPLCGYLLARLLGLSGEELRIILILLACPTASAAFVMAESMRADAHLTAGAIVVSTVLSLLPLSLVNWIFLQT